MTYAFTLRYLSESSREEWPGGLSDSFAWLFDAFAAAQKAREEEEQYIQLHCENDTLRREFPGVTASVYDATGRCLITITKAGVVRAHTKQAREVIDCGGRVEIAPAIYNYDQAPDSEWHLAADPDSRVGTVAEWKSVATERGVRLVLRKRTREELERLRAFTDPVVCTPFISGFVGAQDLDAVWSDAILEMRARVIVGPIGPRTRDLFRSWTKALGRHGLAKERWLGVGREVLAWANALNRRQYRWKPGDSWDACDSCSVEFVCMPRSPVWRDLVGTGQLLCRSCRLTMTRDG